MGLLDGYGRTGSAAATEPSSAKNAHPLDPDLHPWERQPGEDADAYEMFSAYRDMASRSMAEFDQERHTGRGWNARKARDRSSQWSWGYRAYRFDRYMGEVELEELVRYRRQMARRHRDAARAAQGKVLQWLRQVDPATFTPFEAARWFTVAVAIERDAAADPTDPLISMPAATGAEEAGPPRQQTLAELAGIDPTVEDELAAVLARLLPPR